MGEEMYNWEPYAEPPPPEPPPAQIPNDVYIPTLAIKGEWPPPVTGDVPLPEASGGDLTDQPPDPPPPHSAFAVVPATIKDAEATIMAKLQVAVERHGQVRDWIIAHKDWIFYKPSADAPHNPPSKTALDMVNLVDNTMLCGADACQLTGVLVSTLNATAQAYAHVDKVSFPPST